MAWNETKFEHDAQTGRDRIERWGAVLGTPEIRESYEQFVSVIRKEGEWQSVYGEDPRGRGWEDLPDSIQSRDRFVNALKASNAYHVSALWATEHQGVSDWATLTGERQAQASAAVQNETFWVKATSRPAEGIGAALEGGSAGGVVDQLNFGLTGTSYSPTLWALWGQHSKEFASSARGVVDSVVFEGVPDKCVLRSDEWPELDKLIKAGLVDHLHVNAVRRNSETGLLQKVASFDVRTQEQFDALPRSERTDSYVVRQQREFVTQNIARAIDRNVRGVQTSLDDFRHLWQSDGEETHFLISHPDGPGPDLSQSPDQLSRWQTNTSSQEDLNRPGVSATTLLSKLEALDREVALQRRGSMATSIFPARRPSDASTYTSGTPYQPGLHGGSSAFAGMPLLVTPDYTYTPSPMDPYRVPYTLSHAYTAPSPSGGLPAISENPEQYHFPPGPGAQDYFPQQPLYSHAPPDHDGGTFNFHDAGTFNSHDGGTHNPAGDGVGNYSPPSTASGDYEDGSDLTRVQGHTGNSPERFPTPPSQVEESHRPKNPFKSKPSGGKKR